MTSVHATRALWTALGGVAGVIRAEVTLAGATIEHDGSVTTDQLVTLVTAQGFVVIDARETRALRVVDADEE